MLQDPNLSDEEMRPIAIHVERIVYDVDLKHIYRKRVAVVDLELTHPMVMNLIRNLQKKIDGNSERGAIRVRFKGRMVLE